jgi:hypothetical protein
MAIELFVTPAYVGECISDDHAVYYIEIGIIEKGIPRMMVRNGGVRGGISVGFFRDNGLIEIPLNRVFASRHMAEDFLSGNLASWRQSRL